MPNSLRQVTIAAGGTAQELIPARLGRSRLIVTPLDEDCWINVGSTNAAVDTGELVYQDSPAQFTVEKFPEIGGAWTVYSATTNSRINIREA